MEIATSCKLRLMQDGGPTANEEFYIPPRYAVRNYFKRQAKSAASLMRATAHDFCDHWCDAYERGKLRPSDLAQLADEYKDCITANGAFGIGEQHVPGSRALPQRERRIISGYFMEPIGLGQPSRSGAGSTFREEAVVLRTCRAELKPRKSRLGYGTGGLLLPQHLLERVYERSEVDNDHFAELIHGELHDLLLGLGLAEAIGAWLEGQCERGLGYRLTAVPFSNGLIIVNTRILFGRPEENEFGFRVSIPSGNFHASFINPSSLLDNSAANVDLPALQSIVVAAGVTYFNVTTLSDTQADYYHSFEVLKRQFGPAILAAMAVQHYTPRFPHEPMFEVDLTPDGQKSATRLKGMLASGWVKPPKSHPVCCILPTDFT